MLPASIRSFNGEFKWLAAILGGMRDLDVARGNLPHFLSEIPRRMLRTWTTTSSIWPVGGGRSEDICWPAWPAGGTGG